MGPIRIGIDPGSRYIGLAVAEIDEDDHARPLYLDVIDLGAGQNSLRHLVGGRADHRRGRRTRKAAKARIRRIRSILSDAGVPPDEAAAVVALCRRRGWSATEAEGRREREKARSQGKEDAAWSLRQDRAQVIEYLRSEMPRVAPSITASTVERVLGVLQEPPKAHGVDNKLVGNCRVEGCEKKRAIGIDYPCLWLALGVLPELLPRARDQARQAFVSAIRARGYDLQHDPLPRFRVKDKPPNSRARHRLDAYQAVREAWREARSVTPLPDSVQKNVDRLFGAARRQLRGSHSPSRLAYCPSHLRESVLRLTRGQAPIQGRAETATHSLTWEAVADKLRSYLGFRLKTILPEGAVVDRILVERAAFDLVHIRARSRGLSERVLDEARWIGPYGQLRRHYGRLHPNQGGRLTDVQLLAMETGGLCILCGHPLGSAVDRAHLVQREQVGGYPYISIVAAHPVCNAELGANPVRRVAADAVTAMRRVRDEMRKKDGFVHAFIDAKLGALNALTSAEQDGPVPVERYLRQAFATRESVMQGTDRLGEAVRAAVKAAGFGDPAVRKRSASEIAGARFLVTSEEDGDPWFVKRLEKKEGGVLNHAIDAFVVAALPDATPIGYRKGEQLWGVDPQRIKSRLALLNREDDWIEAAEAARPKEGLTGKGDFVPTYIMHTTMRRVWRQAYPRDTRLRKDYSRRGRGAYRVSAQKWINELATKARTGANALEAHILNLQFAPLRSVALEAYGRVRDSGDARTMAQSVRAAVLRFLKAETLAGLARSSSPVLTHPVVVERHRRLREWAESEDDAREVPPWVSVTIREDRAIGAENRTLPIADSGGLNLESWAMHVWVLAIHHEGTASIYNVEADGRLTPVDGAARVLPPKAVEDLAGAVPVSTISPLGPQVIAWRRKLAAILKEAGFTQAWVVGEGSLLATGDGKFVVLRDRKDLRRQGTKELITRVERVVRGGVSLPM